MTNPAAFALARPRVVALATALAVLYGALSYGDLPRQENPSVVERFVSIDTYLPGAEPAKVELLVTKVLEDHIAEVDDLADVFSRSYSGGSFVLVEVKEGAPVERRKEEIRDKVREAQLELPEGASEPDVDLRSLRTYTMVLALVGPGIEPIALREHAREIERDLEALPDVARADLLGLPEEEIEVALDLRALSERGLSLDAAVRALERRNVLLPGGELELGALRSPIRATGAFDAVHEIASTLLGAGAGGHPVILADVARVERRLRDPEVIVRHGGEPAVSIAVEMLPGRNAVAFGERVRRFVEEREALLPEGAYIAVAADEPRYVEERLATLTGSLLLGMALVVGLTLAGMGWRSGLVISASIPLAIAVALCFFEIADVTLHQISISGLVIAIGLVVDEAIVVTDNVQRHLDLGESPREAAVRGLGEIHLAVLAGAATTVAAFIPLMLMRGDIGDFVRSIPVVVCLMLGASVAVAHYVTPLLAIAAHHWRGGARREPRTPGRAARLYARLLRRAVDRGGWVLASFAAAFAASLGVLVAVLLPPSFFPPADRHQFLIRVHLPPNAPVEETSAVMARIEARLAEHPEVSDWTVYAGAGAPKFYYNEFTEGRSENTGMAIVNTGRHLAFAEMPRVVAGIDRELKAGIDGAWVRASTLQQGYSSNDDVEIYVEGDDLRVLRDLADRIRRIARETDGVILARESFGYDPLTLEARVDPARANLLGLSHRDVAAALRTALDGAVATSFREDDEEIDVVVRLAASQRTSVASLETLPLYSPSRQVAVPLAHVASLVPDFSTRLIMRWNRKREAAIWADVEGVPVLEATDRIEREVRERVRFPLGYRASFYGQHKEVAESFASLARAALLAVFLIYIILVVRFQSLSQPLLIVLAIPMALMGAVAGLAVTGHALGFMAFLGMISLTGIVVNDSIILLDYVNTLRGRGAALETAVLEGAATRMRPVLMTSITTIGGLLPLSLAGGALFGPFGFTMIFGLAASTLLTLVVQPTSYLMLERRRARFGRAPEPASQAD